MNTILRPAERIQLALRQDSASGLDRAGIAARSGRVVSRALRAGQGARAFAGHINRKLGDPDYPATSVLDDWISKQIGI